MGLKNLFFGQPSQRNAEGRLSWAERCLRRIETESRDSDWSDVAKGFTLATFTETRSLDPATATATDVANVLCTLISDMAKRGAKRG